MINVIKEPFDICFYHIAKRAPLEVGCQALCRITRSSALSVREAAVTETPFEDGSQYVGYRLLDDLVLQRRYPQRSLFTIGLWNEAATHCFASIAFGFQLLFKLNQIRQQVFSVRLRRDPINSRTRILVQSAPSLGQSSKIQHPVQILKAVLRVGVCGDGYRF